MENPVKTGDFLMFDVQKSGCKATNKVFRFRLVLREIFWANWNLVEGRGGHQNDFTTV